MTLCIIFDHKLSFLPHIRHLNDKCTKALNLLRVVAHTTWGADQQTLIHLYRSLIRSKLEYGCVVYGSYLRILDPIQNHALRLCLGAYRTSPSSSLSVLANEPPLYIHVRRKRLSIQYCLKLSSTAQNPAYSVVFAGKFKLTFDRKPNQIPPLGFRVQPDLHAIGFKQKDAVQSSISSTPPWLLDHPCVKFDLIHHFRKEDTPPEIYRSRFHELCSYYDGFHRLYTNGSKIGDQVASAAVARNSDKTIRCR